MAMKVSTVFALICLVSGVSAAMFALSHFKLANDADALESRVLAVEDKAVLLKARLELHKRMETSAHKAVSVPEEPDGEPDAEFDKPESKCRDGDKLTEECAPKQRIENKGNRNHCVEVAEGPVGASDALMDKVGFEADIYLREHVAWVRHGLGTRAKDKKRVVRYYTVTKEVAQASCQFLSCSQVWLDVEADETPGVLRTCKVMKGKACDI